MKLQRGTALAIDSPETVAFHGAIAERLHGLLTAQDGQPLRLHITIQNKVTSHAAKALQAELERDFEQRAFRFRGFGLYGWEQGLWRPLARFPFRGGR